MSGRKSESGDAATLLAIMDETTKLVNTKAEENICEHCKIKRKEHQGAQVLTEMRCTDDKVFLCDSCIVDHGSKDSTNRHATSASKETLKLHETDDASQNGTESNVIHKTKANHESINDKTNNKDNAKQEVINKTDQSTEPKSEGNPETGASKQSIEDQKRSTDQEEIIATNHPPKSDCNLVTSQIRKRELSSLNVLLEKFLECLKDAEYSKLSPIIKKPAVEEKDLQNFWEIVSPYLIQRIKMWNGYAISPQNINSFLTGAQTLGESTYNRPMSKTLKKKIKKDQTTANLRSLSRIDFLTLMLNTADPIVAQDIMVKLAKFHVVIPLAVQDLTENGHFIVTLPIIQNILIKSEPNPGEIKENRLLSNQFRLIVGVRIGNSKVGKSTIMNQMMSKSHVFSSYSEPGSRIGKSLSLEGMVELIWLTQDTCKDSYWNLILEKHYKHNSDEIVLLANLHGDAMDYVETIEFLTNIASSFIIFQMPDGSDERLRQLKEIITCQETVLVLVKPKDNENGDDNDDNCNEAYEIITDSLQSEDTQETLTCILQECTKEKLKVKPLDYSRINSPENVIRCLEYSKYEHADAVVNFVRENGCLEIKQLMKEVKKTKFDSWTEKMRSLIEMSLAMFCYETKTSLTYLETELSKISGEESVLAQREVLSANEKLRRIVKMPRKTTADSNAQDCNQEQELKSARDELQRALAKVDDYNLGQEHFFRLLGHIYKESLNDQKFENIKNVRELPGCLAELLISGHAIEILDGDAGDIQSIWIQAIFKNVQLKRPNLKVFVISIIGVQSSGKSTLLNALFSCRFAVSVGRCSRGLFMRMIFLDDELLQSHGFHCILLIDTEGLCSPEKMNDNKANQKDRLMATFAMGISNLTIVNILGEGMTEMTEILQIAIIAMARLRSGGIRPDILMVQHLQERNVQKTEQAKGQFCNAIKMAFELINKNDVEIGSASAECLTELVARIHSGDLFKHFGPFKDGSSVNSPPSLSYHEDVVSLYVLLLEKAKNCSTKSTFGLWSHHFESYWSCAKDENFALNFKNVRHISDFLYFSKMLEKVKEALDVAIRSHREIFSKTIKEIVASLISDAKEFIIAEVRKKLNDAISKIFELLPNKCYGNSFRWSVEPTREILTHSGVEAACDACKNYKDSYNQLLNEISKTEWEQDIKTSLENQRIRLIKVTLNVMKETFDASVIRQGSYSRYCGVISTELEQSLKKRPHGKYSEKEIEEIVEKIWSSLKKTASSEQTDHDIKEEILRAVAQVYSDKPNEIPMLFNSEITLDILRSAIEIESSSKISRFIINPARQLKAYILSENRNVSFTKKIEVLIAAVDRFIIDILQSDENKGMGISHEKVRQIKDEFPSLVKRYEDHQKVQLGDEFKLYLQVYILQQIRNKLPASIDIHKRINLALNREYVNTGLVSNMLDQFRIQETNESLQKLQAFKLEKTKLDEKRMTQLLDDLLKLVLRVFERRDNNWQHDGLNFEDGMISEIKSGFPNEIKHFEKQFDIVLSDKFKLHLQIYSLQQLRNEVIVLQTIWNRQNKPSQILEQKREEYRREIEIRLKYGFSGAGDGLIAAMKLSNFLQTKAINAAKLLKIKTVKDAAWATNAENVRLQYFEELAKEVKEGKKERALMYFRFPKYSIEEWFKRKVDETHDEEAVKKIYLMNMETELNTTIASINGCSTQSEIVATVKSCIKGSDDQHFTKLSDKEIEEELFKNSLGQDFKKGDDDKNPTDLSGKENMEAFKKSLVSQLKECLKPEEGETPDFPSVSEDPEIIGRLGCTEKCPWCGALCWRSRDHQSGRETGRAIEHHHTCHQPPGLNGTNNRNTKQLLAEACNLWEDSRRVYFGEYRDSYFGLQWSVAKAKHFEDWKFDAHCTTAFDELMRWFFQMLHVDIAKSYNLLPADKEDLKKHEYKNVNLQNILDVIRSKISKT